jgi:hypothetical protein
MSRTITGLDPDPARAGFVRVQLDGTSYCSLPVTRIAAAGFTAGDALDARGVRDLNQAADEEAAYRTLLRTLERRSFAVAELRRTLVRKGHEGCGRSGARPGTAGRVADDAAFAARFVQSRPKGPRTSPDPARSARGGCGHARHRESACRGPPPDHDPELPPRHWPVSASPNSMVCPLRSSCAG